MTGSEPLPAQQPDITLPLQKGESLGLYEQWAHERCSESSK